VGLIQKQKIHNSMEILTDKERIAIHMKIKASK